jgi:hypothetical protein
MEALERRAVFMLAVIVLMFVGAIHVLPNSTSQLVVWLTGLACLAAATVLLVATLAPAEYIGRWDSERSSLLFYAFALISADIIFSLALWAYSGYEAAKTGFG